ncbi:SUMF1/EgtB/PvdO family nonheme iron enzyme [Gammaproteobacteria bacterium]|nr:SUMF1/EgtB/PvdO family nonheme iron enzyme [Gammaproteobacteria bacterium]
MENRFKSQLLEAKQHKLKQRWRAFGLAGFVVIFMCAFYLFNSAYRVNVELRELKSEVDISLEEGFAAVLLDSFVVPFSSDLVISVGARGYQTKKVKLPHDVKIISIPMEYDSVSLVVNSSNGNEKFDWYLEDKYVSYSSSLSLKVLPGEHSIKALSRHYESEQLKISVLPGEDFSDSLEFKKRGIPVAINSDPSGVKVYIDGVSLGLSPMSSVIPSDSVTISINDERFEPVFELVDLSEHRNGFDRIYQLERVRSEISVEYKPSNGRLLVDNILTKATEKVSVALFGQTLLTYSKEGYESKTMKVDRDDTSVALELDPIFGDVKIKSTPRAMVYVEKVPAGFTPLSNRFIAANKKITLVAEGFVPKEIELKPVQGRTTIINATLQSWFEFHLAESKNQITNEIGIELVRVLPQAFKMGAPRDQIGQRANEFHRNVSFRRWIYIAKHEVTNKQFALFTKTLANNKDPKANIAEPKTNISWTDAALFCNWLSKKEGLSPFYRVKNKSVVGYDESSRGYRLPTEAEWEYMARLHKRRKPTIFAWGNDYQLDSSVGNIADVAAKDSFKIHIAGYNDGFENSSPTGSFQRELSGLFDQSGNVSEWVHDGYSLEVPDDEDVYYDYLGARRSNLHFVKGSNYSSASWTEFRATFREPMAGPAPEVGFRVARYIN